MEKSGTVTETAENAEGSLFYPPGGLLLWIVIVLELLTFGIALAVMAYMYTGEKEVFQQSAARLNLALGSANTLILLTSGYFMALSVQAFKQEQAAKSRRLLKIALGLGLMFIGAKTAEYSHKIDEGLVLGTNTFFDFYWLLTGFHLVHMLVGISILLWQLYRQKSKPHADALSDLESGAAFWHLCDLIWLLLFPMLYLVFK